MTIANDVLESALSKAKEENQIREEVVDGLRQELTTGKKPRVDELVEAFSRQDAEVIE